MCNYLYPAPRRMQPWNMMKSEMSDSDDGHKLTVESVDSHIWYYSEVNPDRGLALVRAAREIDDKLRNENISRSMGGIGISESPPIWLHIQSPGGMIFSAFAIADQLKLIQTPIYSVVEGYAASAATIISACCSKRFILPSALMLIHQLSAMAWGKYDEIKDEAHALDMEMELLVKFYTEHSKMKRKKVEDLLQRDSWFNAQECLQLGLVDQIL